MKKSLRQRISSVINSAEPDKDIGFQVLLDYIRAGL